MYRKERNLLTGIVCQGARRLVRRHRLILGMVGALALLTAGLPAPAGDLSPLKQSAKAFASVAKSASPAVVFIRVEKRVDAGQGLAGGPQFNDPFDLFGDEFMRRFFDGRVPQRRVPRQQQVITGQGSGFIISHDGYILTNNHVVGDADKVTVKLADGREFEAETVGTDPHGDVAVIRIDAKDLPVIPLGDSDALDVGEWVLALGNPFGLSHTLTAGIVSAKGRNSVGIADYEDFIQTDAAINPGNSGGPLLNLAGEAVGINTAIFSRSGGYMGIGFAIPINMAKHIRDQLIAHGKVSRGYLGIMIQPLTPELAKSFGLKDNHGVLVAGITGDGPAGKAGVKQGDVVVSLSGKPVKEVGAFRNAVALLPPGTTVYLTVMRNGKKKEIEVKLGELPDTGPMVGTHGGGAAPDKLGVRLQPLTPELAQQFGYVGRSGVLVAAVEPGSPAAMAGIRPGTLVEEVNRQAVTSVDELRAALAKSSRDGVVLMLVREGEHARYLTLRLGEK